MQDNNDDFENDDFENDDFENDDFENDDFENDDFENDDFENDDFEDDEQNDEGYCEPQFVRCEQCGAVAEHFDVSDEMGPMCDNCYEHYIDGYTNIRD